MKIPLHYFFSSFLVDDTQALSKSTVQQSFAQTYAKIMPSCFSILNVFFSSRFENKPTFYVLQNIVGTFKQRKVSFENESLSCSTFNFKHLPFKGLVIQRWGTPGRWGNPLRWDNPPVHIISYFIYLFIFLFLFFCFFAFL